MHSYIEEMLTKLNGPDHDAIVNELALYCETAAAAKAYVLMRDLDSDNVDGINRRYERLASLARWS